MPGMSRLRLLLLVAAVVYAVLATWTLAGAQSPAPVARGDAKLDAQIATCNTELATGYFPEEEAHIAAYLNLRYYKFEP